jgi:hypothetical protein
MHWAVYYYYYYYYREFFKNFVHLPITILAGSAN